MNNYKISYTNASGLDIIQRRKAETAADAIEKLCDQYGWSCSVSMISADNGIEWAVCKAATDGSINYDLRIQADIINQED